ncbi:hypothetical protein [Streptomyces sp. IBSBF 2950]|uniref:hypothetical protein n=1 Tax=Streptomyces sp. IBSBF 2950 TaxID=2903528 RepID=UPI002FDBF6D4
MPNIGASVHEDVANAFKERAAQEGISTRAYVRSLLYAYAREEFGLDVEAPPATAAVVK